MPQIKRKRNFINAICKSCFFLHIPVFKLFNFQIVFSIFGMFLQMAKIDYTTSQSIARC